MTEYDYEAGCDRVKAILNNRLDVLEQDKVPSDDKFTFENGYYSWVSSIFVDIRKSSKLFADEDKVKVSKIIRSFTSEVIEILRIDEGLREIGIRGDCVYAIYTTPLKSDIYELANKTFFINTYMKMLNKLLENKDYPTISVGIGMSTAQELVVKAGRKDTGINNKVWIGEAVMRASNLSSLGGKYPHSPIVYSSLSYDNFIEKLVENDGEKVKSWFTQRYNSSYKTYYDANIINLSFDKWIDENV